MRKTSFSTKINSKSAQNAKHISYLKSYDNFSLCDDFDLIILENDVFPTKREPGGFENAIVRFRNMHMYMKNVGMRLNMKPFVLNQQSTFKLSYWQENYLNLRCI